MYVILVVFQRSVEIVELHSGYRGDQLAVESGHSEAGHQSRSEHLLLQVLRRLPLWRAQRVEEHLEVSAEDSKGFRLHKCRCAGTHGSSTHTYTLTWQRRSRES